MCEGTLQAYISIMQRVGTLRKEVHVDIPMYSMLYYVFYEMLLHTQAYAT